ncbi:MAG: hypothetical protein DCC68_05215 [Planctomycetota bacterium]|nr:MAG: hypothetical protein DCC68_05215 [Planctomycetota bacterium]
MASSEDASPKYWLEYSNLQRTKHELIRNYLNGWFPKLGYWSGRVVYLDTHAGRGRHLRGELGSPLVALTTLLEHSHRDRLLERSEAVFSFIERDEDNLAELQREIAQVGDLPPNVKIETIGDECFQALDELLRSLREEGNQLAPAFIFVDPYGFKVPGRILRELMEFPRVELFVNVIWRELDMAISQGHKAGMAAALDFIFDGPEWRERITSEDFDVRADEAIDLLREKIGARWATYIRMLGDNGATRYILLHLTNHDDGRDLMKDCMWKVCPDGGFYVRKWDDPSQQFLITPEPDLAPLEAWVIDKLSKGPRRWQELIADVRPEIWRVPHLNAVIRDMRKKGRIAADQFQGKVVPSRNPRLTLVAAAPNT